MRDLWGVGVVWGVVGVQGVFGLAGFEGPGQGGQVAGLGWAVGGCREKVVGSWLGVLSGAGEGRGG